MASSVSSLLLISVLFLVNLRGGDGQAFDWCSLKCGGIRHTMCEYKAGGPASCSAASNGLTDAEKQMILQYHNELRATVARGAERDQPSASDMNELLWDDEIAEGAQRWIEQCQFNLKHDKCRDAKNGEPVGQNLAAMWGSGGGVADRKSTIKEQVRNWYDEVKTFNKNLINGWWNANWQGFGHYTALVWASTTHVGCGVYTNNKGGGWELKLACNYKPAGNMMGRPVYTVGPAASKCASESKKYSGLCSPGLYASTKTRQGYLQGQGQGQGRTPYMYP